jgi:tRNA-2-methylthio-N6-dimethylallyladenosine synthase
MNVHDSEKIAGILSQEGFSYTDNPKEADVIIFNTCSIREKAEQKFFSELGRIKHLKRRRPDLKIAVAGCIAQHRGEDLFKKAPHIDIIFGPQNIHRLGDLIKSDSNAIANDDNPELAELELPVLRKEEGRAWVSIMYGCDNFCSYCIVPYTRGRERSRSAESIIKEVQDLALQGFKEVTLLGQNVNSYRSSLDFPGLLDRINSISGIERIRFVTSHPKDLSLELIKAMRDLEKVCEHIHLPLQSGSSRILRYMNRGYDYDDYRRKIDLLRKEIPNISITTDIIAGFPGETETDHELTLRALREIEYDGIFAFRYSPRDGTLAARMDGQVDEDIKLRRLQEILEVQDIITLKINKKLEGSIQEILVEGRSESDPAKMTGRTRTNKIVNFQGEGFPKGAIINVKIVEAKKHSLLGQLL